MLTRILRRAAGHALSLSLALTNGRTQIRSYKNRMLAIGNTFLRPLENKKVEKKMRKASRSPTVIDRAKKGPKKGVPPVESSGRFFFFFWPVMPARDTDGGVGDVSECVRRFFFVCIRTFTACDSYKSLRSLSGKVIDQWLGVEGGRG